MARKLRLEYAGAMYHVFNRGNYRGDIFEEDGAKDAFEGCLFEAAAKAAWRVHAFIIMRNHYHLALETPDANLVAGMKWLQSTYANRFNRFRGERGHVFQGRYQALLLEDMPVLGAVGHYIHLNPVRAKFLTMETLASYRHSSYWYLTKKTKRPASLSFEAILSAAGTLPDKPEGWRSYHNYLDWLSEEETAQKGLAFDKMCKGWALGGAEFKQGLLDDHRKLGKEIQAETDASEFRQMGWNRSLGRALAALGRREREAPKAAKAANWKVAIAAHLRRTTTASNPWLAQALAMGAPNALSRYVAECHRGLRPDAAKLLRRLEKL